MTPLLRRQSASAWCRAAASEAGRRTLGLSVVAAVVLTLAPPFVAGAGAQQAVKRAEEPAGEPGRARSFEVVLGAELLTPQSLGTSTASLTSNSGSAPFTYFALDGTRATAPAFRARLGYNLTPVLTIEGGVVAARGNVNGTVSADSESATAPTLSEKMTQYFFDVSLLAHLRQLAFSSGAGVPFLEGGGGYLRQLHEGNLAIDTGQIYHFGGGVTYMFARRATGRVSGLGLRAGARVYVPRRGYSFGGSQSPYVGVGGALLVTF